MTAQEMDKSEKKRAKALEKERRENEQALLLKQARSQSAGPEGLGLTPEEIAQRKAQLETQRQRILAAKKKEREETLKEYQEKKQAAGPSASLGRKVSEQHQQVANDVLAAVSELQPSVGPSTGPTDPEIKRLEMRKALAKRLKDDLVLS